MKIVGDLILQRFLFVFCACVFNLVFGASLYHYQDYDNKEIDAVVELKNGDWCAFEIKLGANQIDFSARCLSFSSKRFLLKLFSVSPTGIKENLKVLDNG